jgi:DNA-binding transcriptional ArsR family regulator
MRDTDDGARRGWSVWTGPSATALAACLFSTNIDDNTTRNRTLVPFIGLEGLNLIHRTDTGTTDNGTAYTATIRTKPFSPVGELNHFKVLSATVLAKADPTATITVRIVKDFGASTPVTVSSISLAAGGSESHVVKHLRDLGAAELTAAQFEFTDPSPATGRWELSRFMAKLSPAQTSG